MYQRSVLSLSSLLLVVDVVTGLTREGELLYAGDADFMSETLERHNTWP